MTRSKGSKNTVSLPTSYDIGDGAVNLMLAVLRQAKADDSPMWRDFQGTELYRKGLEGVSDGIETAEWVSQYIGGDYGLAT